MDSKAAIGASPGSLALPEHASRPSISIMQYNRDSLDEHAGTVADLVPSRETNAVTWINVNGLGDAEVLKRLQDEFALHPLALEDALALSHRPKIEPYDNTLFIVTRMVSLQNDALDLEQISLFLGPDFVITLQEREGDCLEPVRARIRTGGGGRIRKMGADYLAYAILDAVVDGYFPVLETLADRLETVEGQLGRGEIAGTGRVLQVNKQNLRRLRRAVWPQREMVGALIREEHEFVHDETKLFLRDCADHIVRIVDLVDGYREWASDLSAYALTVTSNRLNDTMRVLTVIATVFIPLTFVAGIYGMNFTWMPELGWKWGYPVVMALMFVVGTGLTLFFRSKGWLAKSDE